MKNLAKILTLGTIVCAVFVGCSPGTPNCSADETKELVFEAVENKRKEIKQMIQKKDIKSRNLAFKLEAIRTISHDKELDKYVCGAKLIITNKENNNTKETY